MNLIYLILPALVVAFLLTFYIKHVAIKKQILDIPNDRSSHTIPTPRGGGLAIAAVWYSALVVMFFMGTIEPTLFFALLSGLVLSVVSFIDDLKDLSPKIRIGAQFITAVLVLVALGGSSIVDLGLIRIENTIILSLISIPFIIWFINLFNFLDGIDGYLGMEGVFVMVGMWFFTKNDLLLLFAFAILGFLVWNWPVPKAKIFCGDVGSTLIGFNIAVFSIYFQKIEQISILIPLILSALFWFDATLTLFRRWRNKEKLSVAHRKHAYQRIVQAGFSHAKTVYIAIILNLGLFGLGILAYFYSSYSLGILFVSVFLMWFIIKLVDKRKAFI